MNFEIFLGIISLISFIGIVVIIFRKIPILLTLSVVNIASPGKSFWLKLREKIQNIPSLKSFSSGIFLQKILSKIRILSLKADNKTFIWLQRLREKAQKKKAKENNNYWEEIKKSTKEK